MPEFVLISRDTVSRDFVVTYGILPFSATIASVIFDSIYDTCMISKSILRSGRAVWAVSVKEYNHSERRSMELSATVRAAEISLLRSHNLHTSE